MTSVMAVTVFAEESEKPQIEKINVWIETEDGENVGDYYKLTRLGETATVHYSVEPADADTSELDIYSSGAKCIEFDKESMTVKAVGDGWGAVHFFYPGDGYSYLDVAADIRVVLPPDPADYISEINLTCAEYPDAKDGDAIEISNIQQRVHLSYTYGPETAKYVNLYYNSLSPDIASVDQNGSVTFLKNGRVRIECYDSGNPNQVSTSFMFEVYDESIVPQQITITGPNMVNNGSADAVLLTARDQTAQLNYSVTKTSHTEKVC